MGTDTSDAADRLALEEAEAVTPRPDDAAAPAPVGPRPLVMTLAAGFTMGSADLVPGVSGGTVALVLGIYERLVGNLRQGAHALSLLVRGRVGAGTRAIVAVEWRFLAPLLAGILTAIAVLATALTHLLEEQPVAMSALFLGLVAGSCVVAWEEVERPRAVDVLLLVAVAVVAFVGLGLRGGSVTDPSPLVLFGGGAVAICAMILPGVSGSFILLLLGLYDTVITAVSDRDLGVVVAVAAGAAVGLGAFSTVLNWLLRTHHDRVVAALIGLMLGSLRVLWPWPAGPDGVGDTGLAAPVGADLPSALALAVGGAVVVIVAGRLARRIDGAD